MLSSFSISALCIEFPPGYIIPGNRVCCSPRRSDFCMSCVLALVLRVFLISCIVVNQSPFILLFLNLYNIFCLFFIYHTLYDLFFLFIIVIFVFLMILLCGCELFNYLSYY